MSPIDTVNILIALKNYFVNTTKIPYKYVSNISSINLTYTMLLYKDLQRNSILFRGNS